MSNLFFLQINRSTLRCRHGNGILLRTDGRLNLTFLVARPVLFSCTILRNVPLGDLTLCQNRDTAPVPSLLKCRHCYCWGRHGQHAYKAATGHLETTAGFGFAACPEINVRQ